MNQTEKTMSASELRKNIDKKLVEPVSIRVRGYGLFCQFFCGSSVAIQGKEKTSKQLYPPVTLNQGVSGISNNPQTIILQPQISLICVANLGNSHAITCNLRLDKTCLRATHRQARCTGG